MSREVSGQDLPRRPLRGFPTASLTARDALWRVHKQGRSPWWFSSRGGRFDLSEPRGTCYLARDPEAAMRESAGRRLLTVGIVSQVFAAERVISKVHSVGSVALADLTSREAVKHGVSRELTTMTPYDVPRLWAVAFSVEHGGVEYHSRFTTGDMRCVALFGAAGASDRRDPDETVPFNEAARRAGITVARLPRIRSRQPPRPQG